ncbi:MAG: polymerase subunit sigma-24 [Caulobacteraceae bacterium]|jgi:RNA polymerase sigma factor (sigma-70 family)|nr:polymerase subunit sigma-24 [Caulobacteraceae bacterium]
MAPLSGRGKADDTGAVQAQLRVWLDRYGPALRRHFQKRGAGADAEDLVQEVFLRLQVGASRTSIDQIERYIFRVANNVLVSRYRHDLVEGRPFRDPLTEDVGSPELLSPERILLGREYWNRFVTGLEALPPRSREAFLLHRFEEMTYAAIARRMGVSVSAVEKLISRALEQLAAELERL